MKKHKIGLVLSGGGAKGAYEIGVWRALENLQVTELIDGIIGTSVGAMNGALLDTCGLEKAAEVWANLKQSDLLHLKEDKSRLVTETELRPMNNKADYPRLSSKDPEEQRVLQFYRYMDLLQNDMPKDALLQFATNIIHSGFPLTQEKINELIVQNIRFEQQKRALFFFAQYDTKQEKSFADKGCRTGSRKRLKHGFGQHGLNEEKRELVEDGEEGCAREDTLSPKARR